MGRDLNLRPPEHETGMLTTRPHNGGPVLEIILQTESRTSMIRSRIVAKTTRHCERQSFSHKHKAILGEQRRKKLIWGTKMEVEPYLVLPVDVSQEYYYAVFMVNVYLQFLLLFLLLSLISSHQPLSLIRKRK
jgi:hypothetical protein